MEEPICQTSSIETSAEVLNMNVDKQDIFDLQDISPADHLIVQTNINQKTGETVNGCNNECESPKANEKISSPTLIESAFKVMKNLFSPDKSKSKPTNILSTINKPRSASGSPRNSIFVRGKSDLLSVDSDAGIPRCGQSAPGENYFKNHILNNEIPTQSPLSPFNTTDDSFLTTVSLIDESFHSAVTDIYDHGDALKNGNTLTDNALNNSQNLDSMDSYNDTLKNNDSCLENTTLKISSFVTEEKLCDFINKNQDETDNNGNRREINYKDESEKFLLPEKDYEFLERNQSNLVQNEQMKREVSVISNNNQSINSPRTSNDTVILYTSGKTDAERSEQMSDLFFKSLSLEKDEKNKSESFKKIEPESGTSIKSFEGLTAERSLSTTTIILNSVDSVELENMLTSVKASESSASSLTFDGCDITSSLENLNAENQQLKFPIKGSINNLASTSDYDLIAKGKNFCVSEGNSPNTRPDCYKMKLNKSDELINSRISSQTPERKNINDKKQNFANASIKSSKELNISKEHNQSNLPERETDVSSNFVVSQQSYTILTTQNILNRPVIDSLDGSDVPEKDLNSSTKSEKCSNAFIDAEQSAKTSCVKQSTPLSEGNKENKQKFSRPKSLKLYSPELKENFGDNLEKNCTNQDGKKIFPTTGVAEFSPIENEENLNNALTTIVLQEHNELNQTFDKKSSKLKNLKKLPECETNVKYNRTPDKKLKSPGASKKNHLKKEGTPETLSVANRTFSKKRESPEIEKPNQTFTKKSGNFETHDKNLTFDIQDSSESTQVNTTYNKQSSNNQTINNNTFSVESKSQNNTFIKESEVSLITPKVDLVSGLEVSADKTNDVFVKETVSLNEESQQYANTTQESTDGNKTFDKNTKADVGDDISSSGAFSLPENLETRGNKNLISEFKDANESFMSTKSSNASLAGNEFSTALFHSGESRGNESIDDLSGKLEQMNLSDNAKEIIGSRLNACSPFLPEDSPLFEVAGQGEEKLLNSLKEDPDLVQLIQEQFSSNDIEKICSVVHDLSSIKLSSDILRASEQFDKSFHGGNADFKLPEGNANIEKAFDPLSPQSFEFLSSIRGKPTGRDLSRESLYVKFDPLVQPAANSLIDFTKEGEALAPIDESPVHPHSSSICEQLLTISPQKQPEDIVPPLTPLSQKSKTDKVERLKELQNEIYFLKNLYAEREKANKAKMEDYENQIAKLTGENCMLEDKLKSSNEREKSLVKKVKEQTQSINDLKTIMEEYVKVISKLSTELKTIQTENVKQLETLSHEKDSYMTHLQNTEAAFADVHAKYEKSKKTILSLKTNEAMYRNTITEQEQKLESFKARAREAQEKALAEFHKLQEELEDTKANHSQEAARIRAQLRKTELKVEALQESLDQKIKENQQLTAICDELIEGRK